VIFCSSNVLTRTRTNCCDCPNSILGTTTSYAFQQYNEEILTYITNAGDLIEIVDVFFGDGDGMYPSPYGYMIYFHISVKVTTYEGDIFQFDIPTLLEERYWCDEHHNGFVLIFGYLRCVGKREILLHDNTNGTVINVSSRFGLCPDNDDEM
jgi:hypothetical protein